MPLRLLYFGTPSFAVPSLLALATSTHPVVGVVTQPDRPRGRGHKVVPEAVKQAAIARGLRVFQPTKLKDPEFLDALRALSPDLGVVAAYGRILPPDLLSLPRLGLINVHASLLPRWRGAAPIHRAILAGDQVTGVTIMRVVQALDAGPMLAAAPVPIDAAETSVELERRLAQIGADAVLATVNRLAVGPVTETPQDDGLATYARRIERGDGQIDWTRPAVEIHNQIRGLHPWPLAAAMMKGKRVLLIRARSAEGISEQAPAGTVVSVAPDAVSVATGHGLLQVLEIQPEGRPAMPVRAFLNGHHVAPGDAFEPVSQAGA